MWISGHTGFKGSWLAFWLNRVGADVHGYSLAPPSDPNLFESLELSAMISSTIGDVRDIEQLESAFRNAQPEIVFHLAAQSLVRRSFEDPEETYSTNVVGTAAVMTTATRHPSVKTVLVATSDKCYANDNSGRPFKETDRLEGNDHYSASKACTELVVGAYRSVNPSKAPAIATLRAGNVIGGGDWAEDRLIPDLMRSWEREPALIRNPDSIRPWQHVLDCLHGYLILAESMWVDPAKAGPWNFGPEWSDTLTVGQIADVAATLCQGRVSFSIDAEEHPPEAATLVLDSSKARSEIGWASELSVKEALEWTISWYAAVYEGVPAARVSADQLQAFINRSNG